MASSALPAGGAVLAAIEKTVTQAAHTFVVGEWIRSSGAGTYARASADSLSNSEVVGIVVAVPNANSFIYAYTGEVAATGLTAGAVYYLDINAGDMLSTPPTTSGDVIRRLGVALTSTSFLIEIGDGEVVSYPERNLIASGESNNTTSLIFINGLTFNVVNTGVYRFRAVIGYDAAATTTGARFTIASSGALTSLVYRTTRTLTATTVSQTEGHTAVGLPAAASASSLATGNIAIIEGFLTATVAGAITFEFASEVAASAITVLAGSYVEYQRLA